MKQYLILLQVFWLVWVWEPIETFFKDVWNTAFGPCCDKPQLLWDQGPGFVVQRCLNCGRSKTYTRSGL